MFEYFSKAWFRDLKSVKLAMAFSMLAPRWSFCSSPLRESCLRANRRSFAVQVAQAAHRQIDPVGRGRRSWNGLASLATLAGLSGSGLQVRNLVSRMARAKASKAKSRSQDLNVSKCHRCFEGTVFRCNHYSEALGLDACFSVYVPDAPRMQTTLPYPRDCEEFPVLLFLSDEGCSDIEVLMQGGLLEHCAACGLILVSADTSPRSESAKDVFSGGSYYVNATEKPWDTHCRMRDYLEGELLDFVHDNFPTCGPGAVSVMGHGMGGTGALSLALRKSDVTFRSVSALAPFLNPMQTEGPRNLVLAVEPQLSFLTCGH